jgi:cytochrome b561
MLFMYFNKFIIDSLLNLGKTKHKKCEIVTIAIFMHIAKYILIILPIIIGVVINIISDSEIFNLFSLIISALIYPTSSLLSQINLYNKRQND